MCRCEFSEVASKGNLLGRGEVLIAEKDNAIANEGFADRCNYVAAEVLREVNARDFCTEGSGEAPHGAGGCRGGHLYSLPIVDQNSQH